MEAPKLREKRKRRYQVELCQDPAEGTMKSGLVTKKNFGTKERKVRCTP